jgi:hypothetical protein
MSSFAKLDDNNIVIDVLIIPNEFDEEYLNYLNNICGIDGKFVPANPTDANYAIVGFRYHEKENAFLDNSPYPSWIIGNNDGGAYFWIPPVSHPLDEDGRPVDGYVWDEQSQEWVLEG